MYSPPFYIFSGLLSRTIAGLEQEQPVRKYMEPEAFEKIKQFIGRLVRL